MPEHVAVARGDDTGEDVAHPIGTRPHEARPHFDPDSPLTDAGRPLDGD